MKLEVRAADKIRDLSKLKVIASRSLGLVVPATRFTLAISRGGCIMRTLD